MEPKSSSVNSLSSLANATSYVHPIQESFPANTETCLPTPQILIFHDERERTAAFYEAKKRPVREAVSAQTQQTPKKARKKNQEKAVERVAVAARTIPAAAEIPARVRVPALPSLKELIKHDFDTSKLSVKPPVDLLPSGFNGFLKLENKGRVYTGHWNNGRLFSGLCEIDSQNFYQGTFDIQLNFSGKGILHTPTRCYEGQFALNRPEGEGTLTYKNNLLLYSIGIAIPPNFKGSFRAGKPWTGNGLVEFDQGRYSFGEFENGVLKNGVGFVRQGQNVSAGIFGQGRSIFRHEYFLGFINEVENWNQVISTEKLFEYHKQLILMKFALWNNQ